MKLHVVSVKDRAVDAFGRPVFVKAIGEAIRSFMDEANKAESEIHRHPGDYDLYHLGEFNDETGHFDLLDAPKMISRAQDLIQKG